MLMEMQKAKTRISYQSMPKANFTVIFKLYSWVNFAGLPKILAISGISYKLALNNGVIVLYSRNI